MIFRLKKILSVFAVIICFFTGAILLWIFIWICLESKHHDLVSSASPDKQHRIEVKYSTAGSWPYGPHDIHIYLKKNMDDAKRMVAESKLHNDGTTPRASNCKIEWMGSSVAIVKLNGQEMDEEMIKIDCKNMSVMNN